MTTQRLSATALDAVRLPASALVVGGLLLVVLSQLGISAVDAPLSYWLWGFSALGVAAFLLGGWMMAHGRGLTRFDAFTQRLQEALSLTAGQLILLGLAPCFAVLATLLAGRDQLAHHGTASALAWLAAIGCVLLGSVRLDEPRLRFDRRELWVTAVLFGLALFLRGFLTSGIPTTFSGDEGSSGLYSAMFLSGEADNWFTFGWFSFPSFYFAVQSLGIRLFGQTIEALRLGSAVGGALTVVAVYWLGRVMFNQLTGFVSAVLLAFSHYHIHMSRIGLNNIWDGLFGTLAILFLWDGWRSGRRLSFVLCGLALGLGQYFYVSIRVLPLIFLLWAGVAFLFHRQQFRERLAGLALAAFVALIVFLPLGVIFAQYPEEFNAPLARVSIFSDHIGTNGEPLGSFIREQVIKGALGFTHEPLNLLYNPGVPLLLPLAGALFLLGLAWSLFRFDLRILLLLLPLISAVASGSVSQSAPASQRYIMSIPLVVIFEARPIALLTTWLQTAWPRYRRWVLVAAFSLVALLCAIDLRYYFVDVTMGPYVLGGGNTKTATQIAQYLEQQPQDRQVYYFGFPRMGYFSLSTIPYLVPEIEATDVVDPIVEPPSWELAGPTTFIFLPERLEEYGLVSAAYPDGVFETIPNNGPMQFAVYTVE